MLVQAHVWWFVIFNGTDTDGKASGAKGRLNMVIDTCCMLLSYGWAVQCWIKQHLLEISTDFGAWHRQMCLYICFLWNHEICFWETLVQKLRLLQFERQIHPSSQFCHLLSFFSGLIYYFLSSLLKFNFWLFAMALGSSLVFQKFDNHLQLSCVCMRWRN